MLKVPGTSEMGWRDLVCHSITLFFCIIHLWHGFREALNRTITFLDPSAHSRSPVPYFRTTCSETSSSSGENRSKSGLASTVSVPPLDTIPDLPCSSSSASSCSSVPGGHRMLTPASLDDVGFHHLRASDSDDGAISSTGFYSSERSGSKVIAPSRSSSLRWTSLLADLDAEFASAMSRSAHSSVGSSPGKPVTVFSGPSSTEDVFVSHPPSAGQSKASSGTNKMSDGAVGYLTPHRISARTTSSYYSLPMSPLRQHSEFDMGSGTIQVHGRRIPFPLIRSVQHVVTSMLSLRGNCSASFLGDSHDGNSSDPNANSSFTPSSVSNTPTSSNQGLLAAESSISRSQSRVSLARSASVRHHTHRKTSSRAMSLSSPGTDLHMPVEGRSDKENETASDVYNTATHAASNSSTLLYIWLWLSVNYTSYHI